MAYHDYKDLMFAKHTGPMYCVCKVATNFDNMGEWKDEIWSVSIIDHEMEEVDFDNLLEAIDYANHYPQECVDAILEREDRWCLVFNIERDVWKDGDRESEGCVEQVNRYKQKDLDEFWDRVRKLKED